MREELLSEPEFKGLDNEAFIAIIEPTEIKPEELKLEIKPELNVSPGSRRVSLNLIPIDLTNKVEAEFERLAKLKSERRQSTISRVMVHDMTQKKELRGCKRFWGVSLGLLSSLIFSLGTLGVKLMNEYHPITVSLWVLSGLLCPSILIILYNGLIKGQPIFGPNITGKFEVISLLVMLFLRATTGCGAFVLLNAALHYMQIPDVTVIAFSTPVFVIFLARVFLEEKFGFLNILAAIVTLIGVGVIIRPPFLTGEATMDTNLVIGAGFAFGSMTFMCGVYLCLRARVVTKVNYSIVIFFFGFFGVIECAILSGAIGQLEFPRTKFDWCVAIATALGTFSGQVCATLAAKYEEASIISLTRTFDVIFAFIWQFIFLGIIPSVYSLLGSAIVITGIGFVILRKYILNLPQDHPTRSKLSIFLR